MKISLLVAFAAVFAVATLAPHDALPRPKKEETKGIRPHIQVSDELKAEGQALLESIGRPALNSAAAADTFCIVWYDFETFNWQGWTVKDETAQIDTFFHVDDFAGLDGGDYGRLVAIEGTKSAWCGARPGDDFYMCSWVQAPGYGNHWNQALVTDPIPFTGILTFSYHGVFDSEPKWDYTHVEYSYGGDWIPIVSIDGVLDTVAVHTLITGAVSTKLRFHFVSDGSWSDADGLAASDGACIIDSITVSDDNGLIHFEDFESAEVGDFDTDFWHCRHGDDPFGSYTGLAVNLQEKDPCGTNFSTQIVFFIGSFWMSDDYPGLPVTPFCVGAGGLEGPCQDVTVISPILDLTRYSSQCDEVQDEEIPAAALPGLGGAILRFTVYRDLPYDNLVFYNWAVRNVVDDCPGQWLSRTSVYYGPEKEYIQSSEIVSDLILSDYIQVGLSVVDMCDHWYNGPGDCEEHTPAPYFDNVRFYRYSTAGPQWYARNLDLFQDTFPQEVSGSLDPMEEFCRADMANDISPNDDLYRIDPGDSAVVTCTAPYAGGLDTLVTGEARVYFHCNVHFLGPDGKPDLTGSQLEGNYGRWLSTDGSGWDIFLCEPADNWGGSIVPDKYCIDLNDSLFTRGYMIEYYFKAYDLLGSSSTYPESAEETDGDRYEFTCLPTLRDAPSVLYVDDYHNRGTFEGIVQLYMDQTLPDGLGYTYDRYDVNAPTRGVSNGIGAYTSVSGGSSIFCQAYDIVVFDSGDLQNFTISEGTDRSDKSNDAQLLIDWMQYSWHDVGLWVLGDGTASDLLESPSVSALTLTNVFCGVDLLDQSFFDLTGGIDGGGIANPLVIGVEGSPFYGLEYYAAGGCPIINDFDVLETILHGEYGLIYDGYTGGPSGACIYVEQVNGGGHRIATAWSGHSIMAVRDTGPTIPARKRLASRVWEFFEQVTIPPIAAEIPTVTALSDNFPNPFNPATRLKYDLKEKGPVSICIYDVSGRLVRVLVDEIRDAGSYEAIWNGTNTEGRKTASGIYFCRMEAGEYERTLKMVLLK